MDESIKKEIENAFSNLNTYIQLFKQQQKTIDVNLFKGIENENECKFILNTFIEILFNLDENIKKQREIIFDYILKYKLFDTNEKKNTASLKIKNKARDNSIGVNSFLAYITNKKIFSNEIIDITSVETIFQHIDKLMICIKCKDFNMYGMFVDGMFHRIYNSYYTDEELIDSSLNIYYFSINFADIRARDNICFKGSNVVSNYKYEPLQKHIGTSIINVINMLNNLKLTPEMESYINRKGISKENVASYKNIPKCIRLQEFLNLASYKQSSIYTIKHVYVLKLGYLYCKWKGIKLMEPGGLYL